MPARFAWTSALKTLWLRGLCPFEALWMQIANLDPLRMKFGRHHAGPVKIRATPPGFIEATKVRLQEELIPP